MDDASRAHTGVSENGQATGPAETAFRARKPVSTSFILDSIVFFVVFVAAALVALYGAGTIGGAAQNDILLAAGVICMLMTAILWPILRRLYAPMDDTTAGAATPQKLGELGEAIRVLTDHVSLSGDARRVLNRRAEKDLLCRAIEEDINAEDWDAAIVLCRELADRFGYRIEAEEFRAKIDSARGEVQERKVADSIARLDGLIIQRRWDVALREAARIQRSYPDSHRVETLRQRVEQARAVYKADLERRFLDAAQNEHFDEAMDLLKELDSYLTEHEAEPFREVARGVIGKARENLGAQFKVAVRDKQWPKAAAIGRRIINEFPNTRMATEVRELLDGILQRANSSATTTTNA
jgi:hypothetical protein